MTMTNESKGLSSISVYKDVCDKLESFSKHLMLILVAVVAFSASVSLEESNNISVYFFVSGVFLSICSFIAGHEASVAILNAYLKEDNSFRLLPLEESINSSLISIIRNRIKWQYYFSLLALFFILLSVVCATINKNKEEFFQIKCNVEENENIICSVDTRKVELRNND